MSPTLPSPAAPPFPTDPAQNSPPNNHSLATDAEIQKSSTLNAQAETPYVRQEYVRKPYIRAAVPVNCSEPKAVAGHVRKREDKIVAVVAPPVGKKARIGGGGEKEGRDGEEGGGNGGSNGSGEGKGGDEPDPVGVDVADDGDESGEEYESAAEDPWPEEVWNDTPSGPKCAPLSAIFGVEAELGILSKAERRKIGKSNFEHQEKNRILGSHSQYSLFARGRQVWRLEGYCHTKVLYEITNGVGRIRYTQSFFEAWQNRVEIDEQMLEDAGWCWQAPEQQWYTEILRPNGSESSHSMGAGMMIASETFLGWESTAYHVKVLGSQWYQF